MLRFSDDVILQHLVPLCEMRGTNHTLAAVCRRFRLLMGGLRRCTLIATPGRIDAGMFRWLERYTHAMGVPPMTRLYVTFFLPASRSEYQDPLIRAIGHGVATFTSVKLLVQNSVASVRKLATTLLRNLTYGGRLSLNLSYHPAVTTHSMEPMWTALVRLSKSSVLMHA